MFVFQRIALTILLAASTTVMGQTVLYMPFLPGFSTVNADGVYDEIWFEVIRRSGVRVNFIREPYARSIASFGSDSDSCFPVGTKEAAQLYLGIDVWESDEFIFENPFVYATLISRSTIDSADDIVGKRMAYLNGDRPLVESSPASEATLYSVDSYQQAFQMLKAGRVNAVIGNYGDMHEYYEEIDFSESMVIERYFERLLCHPSAENKIFIQKFDEALNSMKSDGTWREIINPMLPPSSR